MKTDDLIATLATDAPQKDANPARALGVAVAIGALVAGTSFMLTLGPRPDFTSAMHTMRFDFKFVVTLVLAASAVFVASRAMRPEARLGGIRFVLLTAPLLLAAAVILELIAVPRDLWMTKLIGQNMRFCTSFIPLFSIGPLALMLWAFRRGAPENPVRAGALAGLVAGGLGAAFYAAHCVDDSPLFVATWYSLAIAFVTGIGALSGAKLLRW
ncbi:MAG TPA: NrsF family protein [Rhizomicrobium sp.]|nr:NrsF family protein [Rhizomicrobium sp.]